MEEILASIRRIISDDQPPVETPPIPTKPQPVVAPVVVQPKPVAAPAPEPVLEDDDVLDLTSPVQPALEVPVFEPAASMQPVDAPVPQGYDTLISQNTDSMVSTAFHSLAHTVLSQNARTIDDVVKDMLRPMLKTWLDDNLPVIVERLVRAEIERVARGGR